MNKYLVKVTESSTAYYVIEAESEDEIDEHMWDWLEENEESISRDLDRCFDGRTYEIDRQVPDREIDVTNAELKGE